MRAVPSLGGPEPKNKQRMATLWATTPGRRAAAARLPRHERRTEQLTHTWPPRPASHQPRNSSPCRPTLSNSRIAHHMGRSFPHHTGPPSCSRWPSLDQASVMSGRLGAPGYASLGAGSTGMTTASAAFRPRTELGHSWNLMPAQRGIEKSSSSLREADCSTAIEPPHDMSTTEPSAMFAVCRMPGLNPNRHR